MPPPSWIATATAATPEPPVSADEPAMLAGRLVELYVVPFEAGVAIVSVGFVVSIVIAALASRLPPVPGAASVSDALFAAASRIVPPASARDPVPL